MIEKWKVRERKREREDAKVRKRGREDKREKHGERWRKLGG